MNTKYYCRNCGTKITTEYEVHEYVCPDCKSTVQYKDLMRSWMLEARVSQLKAMHELMCNANNEGIYMSWIYTVPDCPSHEDFVNIAMNDEQYNECFDKFIKLIQKNGNRW